MRKFHPSSALVLTALVVSALVVGCRPAAQSNVDTMSAASSSSGQPNVVDGARDSASAADGPGGGGSVNPANAKKPTNRATTASKSSSSSKAQSEVPAARDTTIIGWDSVIRFPLRTLPTATSTPTRE